MPPSGYSDSQSNSLAAFLASCAHALEVEAQEHSELLHHAMLREVSDINQFKGEANLTSLQSAVLSLTEVFYLRLHAQATPDGVFEDEVEGVLEEIKKEILAIKINNQSNGGDAVTS